MNQNADKPAPSFATQALTGAGARLFFVGEATDEQRKVALRDFVCHRNNEYIFTDGSIIGMAKNRTDLTSYASGTYPQKDVDALIRSQSKEKNIEKSAFKSLLDFGREMLDAHQRQQSFNSHTREDPIIGSSRGDVEIFSTLHALGADRPAASRGDVEIFSTLHALGADPTIALPENKQLAYNTHQDVEINKVSCVIGEQTVAHPGQSLARQALAGPGSRLFFAEPVPSLDRNQAMRYCVAEHKDKYYFEDGSSVEWHANTLARTTTPVAHYSPEQLQFIALEASKPKVGLVQSLAARMGSMLGVDGTKKPEAAAPNGP